VELFFIFDLILFLPARLLVKRKNENARRKPDSPPRG
jgi:hypothetical protein